MKQLGFIYHHQVQAHQFVDQRHLHLPFGRSYIVSCPLADLGGACLVHAPPYGTQFFRFRIHFHRKVLMSEVHATP